MKITISYIEDEQKEAATIVAVLRRLQPGVKVRESDRHPPFKHVYMNTTKPGKRCNSNKKH